MAEDPIPVVICSSVVGNGVDAALQALEEGAVDVVAKPHMGVRDFLQDAATMLIQTVRGAAASRGRPRKSARPARATAPARRKLTADAVLPLRKTRTVSSGADKLVAIGASTGGVEAITTILKALPRDAPGVVVVQHMPERFTEAFAGRLNKTCAVNVKEAADGDVVARGVALIAPGDHHVIVERGAGRWVIRLNRGPLVSRHRPSVDVLFRSVAQAAGRNAIGVILTGMGDDGARGLLEMKQAGGMTVAQDETTSVVFGMPKEAIERDAADQVVPLPRISHAVLNLCAAKTG
jgi:two-component system chemotaxis response regulator CheB